jgi:hypothetical protein
VIHHILIQTKEASYDDDKGPDISGCRSKSRYLKFDDTAPLPVFKVGMTFRGSEELNKEWLIIGRQ